MNDEQKPENLSSLDHHAKLEQQFLAEYQSLRTELIKRLEIQHQIVLFSTAIAVVLITLGMLLSEIGISAILLYPILALFLATVWVHNDVRLFDIRSYIKARLEKKRLAGLEWENHLFIKRKGSFLRLTELSAFCIFVLVSILALLIANQKQAEFKPSDKILFYGSIVAVVFSTNLIAMRRIQFLKGSKKQDRE
jgi:hypothetical protein